MKTELQEKLFDKYHKIFRDKDESPMETAICWGIECGDGWYWLIDNLCSTIQRYYDNNGENLGFNQPIATQVKEKYGGLRFYTNGGDDTIHGMIWLAESLSYSICEKCGSQENVKTTSGWNVTLCESCEDNNEQIRN